MLSKNRLRSLLAMLLLTIRWANAIGQAQTKNTDTLIVGDAAPPITVLKWVKGNPVTKFKPGKVYVVEFWATWCGPCQAAMPHLSELARKYKGEAEVISFDVKEDKKTDYVPKVERFVKWSDDRMDYSVAIDAAGDVMEKTWLKAAGVNGIPHIFIIDQQGRIAWDGHPDHVDDVLEAVVNGRYDETAKKHIEEVLNKKEALYDTLGHKMMAAKMKGDYKTALTTVEEIFPIFPGLHSYCCNMKYEFLSHIDPIKARQFGDSLLAKLHPKDQAGFTVFILWSQPDGTFKPDYEFALKWVKQAAVKWNPHDKGINSTLALAYYKTGNKAEAIKCQEEYIKMLKADPAIKPAAVEWAEKALAQYKS